MSNIEASPTTFHYVTDRSTYVKKFVDKNNNVIPEKIRNKHFTLSLNQAGTCVIPLSPWICTDNSTIKVKKAINIRNINSSFTEYTEVNHEPTKANEIYFNRQLNYVQFYPSEVGVTQEVVISFEAKEMDMIYASCIIATYGSEGTPIETLDDYLRKVRKTLDAFNTIGDANTMLQTIKYNIDTMSKLYTIVKQKLPELKELTEDIKVQIPIASNKIDSLTDLISKATDIDNRVRKADNDRFYINANNFYWDEEEGMFVYELEHNLASDRITWRFEDDNGDKIVDLGHKDSINPKNVYIVENDEKVNVICIANRGYFGGV